MSKQILIEQAAGEIRAALLEDDQLIQFQVQPAYRSEIVGNIYQGIVRATKPSLDAAFIDIGLHKNAFLPARDLPLSLLETKGRGKALADMLKPGQPILVQAMREAVGEKGTMVTGTIVLPGRFLVLTPEVPRAGVSRRLSDVERERLHKILKKVSLPENAGVIVRTAGEERTQEELEKDLTYLLRLWKAIQTAASKAKGPKLLYREGSLPIRFIREFMTPDVTAVRTNNERIFQDLDGFVNVFAPRCRKRVMLEAGGEPLFRRFDVESQVDRLYIARVPLPGGGSLVVDHTEALVAIDVNSGKIKGKGHEETILKTNLEAASEIARQVILRDIGGLVVIDFIDMDSSQHRNQVEKALREAFAADKARIRLGKISEFGLLELSRQQLRPKLQQIMHVPCPRCSGTGFIKSTSKVGAELLMRIRNALLKEGVGRVLVQAAPDEARHLLNERRRELVEIEDATRGRIEIHANEEIPLEQARIVEHPPLAEQEQARMQREEAILSMYSSEDIVAISTMPDKGAQPEPEKKPSPAEPSDERAAKDRPPQPSERAKARAAARKAKAAAPGTKAAAPGEKAAAPGEKAAAPGEKVGMPPEKSATQPVRDREQKRSRRRKRPHKPAPQETAPGRASSDRAVEAESSGGKAEPLLTKDQPIPVQLPLLAEQGPAGTPQASSNRSRSRRSRRHKRSAAAQAGASDGVSNATPGQALGPDRSPQSE